MGGCTDHKPFVKALLLFLGKQDSSSISMIIFSFYYKLLISPIIPRLLVHILLSPSHFHMGCVWEV